MAKRGTKSSPKAAPKYYSREEAIPAGGSVPGKLFGINEAIIAGNGANLPLFSVRERSMAAAYATPKEAPVNEETET